MNFLWFLVCAGTIIRCSLALVRTSKLRVPHAVLRDGVAKLLQDGRSNALPDGTAVTIYGLDERIGLNYVAGFASREEVETLCAMAEARQGFKPSLVVDTNGSKVASPDRTSASCLLLWPLLFRTTSP